MSGFLRNLSAQALGRSAPVRSAAGSCMPPCPRVRAAGGGSAELAACRGAGCFRGGIAHVIDRAANARTFPGDAPSLGPFPHVTPRNDDVATSLFRARAMRDACGSAPRCPRLTDIAIRAAVAAARVTISPPLIPPATLFVPPPAFASAPPAGAARTAGAHRHSIDGEATEVHVSIGRIELTRSEASPPARRPASSKPSLQLADYLAQPAEAFVSNALAIAGVTAVLRDLLNDGIVNHNVSGILGSTRDRHRAAAGSGGARTATNPRSSIFSCIR